MNLPAAPRDHDPRSHYPALAALAAGRSRGFSHVDVVRQAGEALDELTQLHDVVADLYRKLDQ